MKMVLEEGGIVLFCVYCVLLKNKDFIKYFFELGIKVYFQKMENIYMVEQGKYMKKIDVEFFFVIDEK